MTIDVVAPTPAEGLDESPDVRDASDTFMTAARQVLGYLAQHTPLTNWSVSRIAGGEQVHVHVGGTGFIDAGDRVLWHETFCRRMLAGAAHVVPDSAADPSYAGLPAAADVRAYVGFPINDDDGQLFGTLCGVGDTPLRDAAAVDEELVALFSRLLSGHLAAARSADRGRHAARLATALADTDALTGLMNRRGWDSVVEDAQQRVTAFGDPVAVAVIDIDGLKQVNDTYGHEAGDQLIRLAADALRAAATETDRVARYGGDEFVVLSNNLAVDHLPAHYARFTEELRARGVEASLGHAFAGPGERTLAETFRCADAAMYAAKCARRER